MELSRAQEGFRDAPGQRRRSARLKGLQRVSGGEGEVAMGVEESSEGPGRSGGDEGLGQGPAARTGAVLAPGCCRGQLPPWGGAGLWEQEVLPGLTSVSFHLRVCGPEEEEEEGALESLPRDRSYRRRCLPSSARGLQRRGQMPPEVPRLGCELPWQGALMALPQVPCSQLPVCGRGLQLGRGRAASAQLTGG